MSTSLVEMMNPEFGPAHIAELTHGLALLYLNGLVEERLALAELRRGLESEAMAEFAAGGHTLH